MIATADGGCSVTMMLCSWTHQWRDDADVLVVHLAHAVRRRHDRHHEHEGAAELDTQRLGGVGVRADLVGTAVHLQGMNGVALCSKEA